jgi:hypothetical protein
MEGGDGGGEGQDEGREEKGTMERKTLRGRAETGRERERGRGGGERKMER